MLLEASKISVETMTKKGHNIIGIIEQTSFDTAMHEV